MVSEIFFKNFSKLFTNTPTVQNYNTNYMKLLIRLYEYHLIVSKDERKKHHFFSTQRFGGHGPPEGKKILRTPENVL